jgi:hypothetical protein
MPARVFEDDGWQWTCATLFGSSNRRLKLSQLSSRKKVLADSESQERESNPRALVYETKGEARFHPASGKII